MKFLFLRLAALGGLFLCMMNGLAAGESSVHLDKGEIQRLVYGTHLAFILEERPELEGALLALLELDRRNPEAEPAVLAGFVAQALQQVRIEPGTGYRAPSRDEVLATYLGHLVAVPGHADLRPATFSLLQQLIEDSYAATKVDSQNPLPLAWNQRTLSMETASAKRQGVLEAVVARAFSRPGFASALDTLVMPETAVSIHHSPSDIAARIPELGSNPTLQWLAGLYQMAGAAGIEVSSGELESYFAAEMADIRQTAEQNQSLHKAMESSQGALAHYLDDDAAVALRMAQHEQAQAGHASRIAASAALAHALSRATAKAEPERAGHMITVANSMSMVARGMRDWNSVLNLSQLAACTNIVSAGLGLLGLIMDTNESNDTLILDEIDALKGMIVDLADHVDYRFDRVDSTLLDVLNQLTEGIRKIDNLEATVMAVRTDLLKMQTSLTRLERRLFVAMDALARRDFIEAVNLYLQYEATGGNPLSYEGGSPNFRIAERTFYTWAVSHASDELSSYPAPGPDGYSPAALREQLELYPLEHNLNYIRGFLEDGLGVTGLARIERIANPRAWFLAADAYLKLAVENPIYHRRITADQLAAVIAVGTQLQDFLGSITLVPGTAPSVNTSLFEAVFDYYDSKLHGFQEAVKLEEIRYGEAHQFAPGLWREWNNQADPVMVQETALEANFKRIQLPHNVVQIAAGGYHFLALRADGRVFAWGNNELGQCDVPADLADVISISAGTFQSLALRSDGTVVRWGQPAAAFDVPADLTNVVAIAAGWYHNLALREDGTVLAWGYNSHGQCVVPEGLNDVVAIAVGGHDWGGHHSLALKEDGSVVAWGGNDYGQAGVPQALAEGLEDVVSIAACGLMNAAVLRNGAIIGWPQDLTANSEVTQLALGYRNLDSVQNGRAAALTRHGTVEMIWGPTEGAPQSNDIVQLVSATRESHGLLALHADGTLTAWGSHPAYDFIYRSNHDNESEPVVVAIASSDHELMMLFDDGSVQTNGSYPLTEVPADLPTAVAVATGAGNGEGFCIVLLEDGTVRGWGGNAHGQLDIPVGLTEVVAIAAGGLSGLYEFGGHVLALRKDGSVVAWGDNTHGQCDVPSDLSNVVAVSAGQSHSLALLGDGSVRSWGDANSNIQNVPDAQDIVSISAGVFHSLALRGNGTVLGWGNNGYAQSTVPAGLDNVVAVVAGDMRSLALQADGTVRAWGYLQAGRQDPDDGRSNVLMMSASSHAYSYFLVAPEIPSIEGDAPYAIQRHARPSVALASGLQRFYRGMVQDRWLHLDQNLNLQPAAHELTGAKKLLDAVVSLGLSYSLEQDDALRGLLFGSESIPEPQLAVADDTYLAEASRLDSALWVRPLDVHAGMQQRFEAFCSRLYDRLDLVAAAGTPEIPRMVGHTLALLKGLQSIQLDNTAPALPSSPVLEFIAPAGPAGMLSFALYGEPWIRYELDSATTLSDWEASGQILRDGSVLSMQAPSAASEIFFRARTPVPPN